MKEKEIKQNFIFDDKYSEMIDWFLAFPGSVTDDIVKGWIEELEKIKSR